MSSSESTISDEDVGGLFGGAYNAAQVLILGQGYQPISQDGVRRTTNEAWNERCMSILDAYVTPRDVLIVS